MFAPGDIEEDIGLLSVTCNVRGVTIKSENVEQADRRFIRLTFALGADLPLGSLDAQLTARVRVGEEVADLSIPFKGDVLGDLFLSPPAIISPKTAHAQGQKISEITVRSSSGGPAPEIVGAMAVGPVKALIDQSAGFDHHAIGVYAAENAPRGPQSGTIYVMTVKGVRSVIRPMRGTLNTTTACAP